MKGLKKKEEKEKKSSVKTPGEDPKDNMADNDDSSSTTTETSNPDVETNLKEVQYAEMGLLESSCVVLHLCYHFLYFNYASHPTGTSEEEREDCRIWKGKRRNVKFSKQTQRKETRSFKEREPSR